jgi:hypothetical protein
MSDATFACLTLTVLPVVAVYYVLAASTFDEDEHYSKHNSNKSGIFYSSFLFSDVVQCCAQSSSVAPCNTCGPAAGSQCFSYCHNDDDDDEDTMFNKEEGRNFHYQ